MSPTGGAHLQNTSQARILENSLLQGEKSCCNGRRGVLGGRGALALILSCHHRAVRSDRSILSQLQSIKGDDTSSAGYWGIRDQCRAYAWRAQQTVIPHPGFNSLFSFASQEQLPARLGPGSFAGGTRSWAGRRQGPGSCAHPSQRPAAGNSTRAGGWLCCPFSVFEETLTGSEA